MASVQKALHLSKWISAAALFAALGCGQEQQQIGAVEPSNPAATRLEVKTDADNFIAFSARPNSECTLRTAGALGDDDTLPLFTDAHGNGSFWFKPPEDGVTRFELSCSDSTGVALTQSLELKGRGDIEAIRAPAPKGRVRLPLAEPDSRSAEEIRAAGYPERPDPVKAPQIYALWKKIAAAAPVDISDTEDIPRHVHNNTAGGYINTTNWSGMVTRPYYNPNPPGGGEAYTVVSASWQLPKMGSVGVTAQASLWVGVGDGTTIGGDMWQGGTDTVVTASGAQTTNFWYELIVHSALPGSTPEIDIPQTVAPGDTVYATLWLQPSNMTCSWLNNGLASSNTQVLGYTYYNVTQNYTATHCVAGHDLATRYGGSKTALLFNGQIAEWVLERPAINGTPLTYAYLPDFYEVSFNWAWALDNYQYSYDYSQLDPNAIDMVSCPYKSTCFPQFPAGNTIVYSTQTANPAQFNVYWDSAQ